MKPLGRHARHGNTRRITMGQSWCQFGPVHTRWRFSYPYVDREELVKAYNTRKPRRYFR